MGFPPPGAQRPRPRFPDFEEILSDDIPVRSDGGHEGGRDSIAEFEDVENVAGYYTSYAGTTTVSLMIMTLRLIKMLDFQPRMGLVTRTVSAALNDLGHFFGLFTLVFVGLAAIAFLNFGRSLEKFSSIGWSIDTCFRLMLGDTEPYEAMLTTTNAGSAILFYYCFMIIVFFVLLNMVIV